MMKTMYGILMAILVAACGNSNNSTQNLEEEVAEMEKELMSAERPNYAKVEELELKMFELAEKTKDRELAPKYLLKAAELAKANPDRAIYAIHYIDKLHSVYPKSEEAPKALFLRGIIWDEVFHDTKRAQESMEMLIHKYPLHELAVSARELREYYMDTIPEEEKVKQWLESIPKEEDEQASAQQ